MWSAWSQCCHCNVCLPIALWGGKKKNGEHLPVLSVQLQCINSITPLTPFTHTLSLLSQSISFPIFFLRCPDLIYPFYLPAVFAAISSLLCLSLIPASRGKEAKGFRRKQNSGRRSVVTKMHRQVQLMVMSHLEDTNIMHTCPSRRWPGPDIWSMLWMRNEYHEWHPYLSVSHSCHLQ